MANRLVNFKLTVVSRIAAKSNDPTLEEVRRTILEVLGSKELIFVLPTIPQLQSHVDYESDMRELAEKYGFQEKDLVDLIPDLELTHDQ